MTVITSPERIPEHAGCFLAGGTSNCPDWQHDVLATLDAGDGRVIANPRRRGSFRPEDAEDQITWEWNAMRVSRMISFWFPCETLCPIALFELGKAIMRTSVRTVVGVHPSYARKMDIETQLGLERSDIMIVYSLDDLLRMIRMTI
jgi:hypothetical protein